MSLEQRLFASTDAGGYGSQRKAGTTKTWLQSTTMAIARVALRAARVRGLVAQATLMSVRAVLRAAWIRSSTFKVTGHY